MPRFFPDGSLCIGRGRDPFDHFRSIAQECNTLQPGCVVALSDRTIVPPGFDSTAVVGSGHGHWAAMVYPSGDYRDSFGRYESNDTGTPWWRTPTSIGPDGAVCLRPHSNAFADVLEPSNLRWTLSHTDIFDEQLLGNGRAIYRERRDPHPLRTRGLTIDQPQGDYGQTRAIWTGDRFALLYQSETGGCLVFDGRVIAEGVSFYRPDALLVGDVWWFVWSTEPQEVGATPPILKIPVSQLATLETIQDRLAPDPTPPDPEPVPEPEPEPEPQPPDPAPQPPPLRAETCWLGPNIGSLDLLALFDDMRRLSDVGVLQLYIQHVLDLGPIGPNTYDALVAKDAFRKLRAAGIALAIEGGAVKPGNCQALDSIQAVTMAVERVRAAGGEITHYAMDEPLTAAKDHCQQTQAQTADYTANFITHARSLGVQSVGWIEAWPHIALDAQKLFLKQLTDRGAKPSFWHLDIDWRRAVKEGKSARAFILDAAAVAKAAGIPLGVILISDVDPVPTDAAWVTNVHRVTRQLHAIHAPDHLIVQSWTTRTGGVQDVPYNLHEPGLLTSLADVVAVFDAGPPPPPIEWEDEMLAYGKPVPGFEPGEEHDNGDGTFSIKKPNGKWLCCTPDGYLEERNSPGGLWESFVHAKSGTSIIAKRDGGAAGPRVWVLPRADF